VSPRRAFTSWLPKCQFGGRWGWSQPLLQLGSAALCMRDGSAVGSTSAPRSTSAGGAVLASWSRARSPWSRWPCSVYASVASGGNPTASAGRPSWGHDVREHTGPMTLLLIARVSQVGAGYGQRVRRMSLTPPVIEALHLGRVLAEHAPGSHDSIVRRADDSASGGRASMM
jgi:hypothetical protein